MTRLAFVHGVATRNGNPLVNEEKVRDQLFREVVFKEYPLEIKNIFWGDLGANAAWEGRSWHQRNAGAFGIQGSTVRETPANASSQLAQIARQNFPIATEILLSAMVENAAAGSGQLTREELRLFELAPEYAAAPNPPIWLADCSDETLAAHLLEDLAPGDQSLGLGTTLSRALATVRGRLTHAATLPATSFLRKKLADGVTNFIGDAFLYLYSGATREAIRNRIASELVKFADGCSDGEPLVCIGHSFGGVILVDLLSETHMADKLKNLSVNLLVTVGSQPGFFEELKLFASSSPDCGTNRLHAKAPSPHRVKDWWNVYDSADLLSFACEPIFDGVQDYSFNTESGFMDAHSSYFHRPLFFDRLKHRLIENGLLA